jgi:hypothetical protein
MEVHLWRWSPEFTEIWKVSVRKSNFVYLNPSEGPIYFEQEGSYSSGTGLQQI